MSYKLKTLIVFDTNSLRSTDSGEVAYSFFAFGRPFQMIENFIIEKNLMEDVHIAIPTWAIEELKDQKQIQYKEDFHEFKRIAKRLSGMPHIQEIVLPEIEFDCAAYIQQKSDEFLATKELKLMGIPEANANAILQNMMHRVMKEERMKHPFVHAKKGNKTYKDAGFKDNLIWESLLHFQEIENYDKVIFLTADSDYTNCKAEFIRKWNKHFTILQDENNVLVEVQKDYDNYIKERSIHDFVQTEYFVDYLKDQLKVRTAIVIEGVEYKIENYTIADICKYVNRLPPNDNEVENLIISSIINIHFTKCKEKVTQPIEAQTLLWDDETKDIISTEYNFDIK